MAYKLMRYFNGGQMLVLRTGLSLKEAEAGVRDHSPQYFDDYTEDRGDFQVGDVIVGNRVVRSGIQANPKRPPKNWWDRCVQGVGKSGDDYSPQQVCGSLWYHKLSAAEKRRITREAEGKLQENIDTTSALAGVGVFFVGAILLGAVLSVTR